WNLGNRSIRQEGRRKRRGEGHASLHQPAAEAFAASLQLTFDLLRRPSELRGDLVARAPFEIAQDQRHAISLWQSLQFRIQHCLPFAQGYLVKGAGSRHWWPLIGSSRSGTLCLRFVCQSQGNAVEPASEQFPLANGIRFSSQDQENRLKNIFGHVRIGND